MTTQWGRPNEMKSKSRKKERRMTTQWPWLRLESHGIRARIPRMMIHRRRRRTRQRRTRQRRMKTVTARNQVG
jgi:hypothetical protein